MSYKKSNPNGQATMANSEPVVIASDQASIPVTVSGVATAANQSTLIGHVDDIEGLLTTIDADTGALAGTVAGTEVQVDVVAALPAGNNNIGDVDVASVNGFAAHDAAIAGNPLIMGGVSSAAAPTSVSADQEAVRAWYLRNGAAATVLTAAGALIGGDATNGIDVDVTRVIPGTSATHLGKARDSAIGATDTGVAILGVRRDTPTAETPVAGDYVVPQISANGEQWVRLAGELADDAAFTVATTRVVPIGFLADETATDSVDEGDAGAARMTLNRRQIMAGNVLDDAAFGIGTEYTNPASFLADETSTDSVDEGDAGIARMTLDRKQIHANYAHTAGGATPYKLVSAASTNATSVKASTGNVYMITASNINAAARYLKLYNKASAPTVGTDVPVHTFIIPGNTAGAGTNIPVPTVGINFSTGIAFALTTEATDAGTTAVAASEIVVNLAYL